MPSTFSCTDTLASVSPECLLLYDFLRKYLKQFRLNSKREMLLSAESVSGVLDQLSLQRRQRVNLPRTEGPSLHSSVVWINYWFSSSHSYPHPWGVSSECWSCLTKNLARIVNHGLLICVGPWESLCYGGRTCSGFECAFYKILLNFGIKQV